MNENDNIALIKKLYEAFAKGDIETILKHVTDDVSWNSPGPAAVPYSGDRTGPAQVQEFFHRLLDTQENVNLTIEHLIGQGNAVSVLGRYSGNVKGTGAPFDSLIGHFFVFTGNKVSRWVGLADTAQAAAVYADASAAGR